ncbi:MAG: PfkB family carbohydrate kinase, partial [bacterium]
MVIKEKRLKQIFKNFSSKNICVVGDFILDEYIWGDVSRISPEAPVPVVKVDKRSFRLGGAANVAANLKALGIKTHCIGVLGDDGYGKKLLSIIKKIGISNSSMITCPGHLTTLKTRIIARHQQVVRVDHESPWEIKEKDRNKVLENINKLSGKVSAIIISDYGKGMITASLMSSIARIVRGKNIITAVDPKSTDFSLYKGATVITPNLMEAGQAARCILETKKDIERFAAKL